MKTSKFMQVTLVALLPGLATYSWYFGAGVLINIGVAVAAALATEAFMLALRGHSVSRVLDGSAALTGMLLGLCLPPLLPLWMVILGVIFALVFGKHVYGGTGQNVFNPAMVGFAMLIVSFPLAMSHWPEPGAGNSLSQVLETKLGTQAPQHRYDGVTGATPLDAYKFRLAQTNDEFFIDAAEANWQAWVNINLAFLIGGLLLLYLGVINWRVPVAFLGSLFVLALLFYDGGSSASLGSPVFHLFSGATMLAAFFIATDPVTGPGYRPALLVFGVGVGLLTFIIRSWGAYPEGVAFAILLMNTAAPMIDQAFVMREQTA